MMFFTLAGSAHSATTRTKNIVLCRVRQSLAPPYIMYYYTSRKKWFTYIHMYILICQWRMKVKYCLALLRTRETKLRDHRKQRESRGSTRRRMRGGGTRRNDSQWDFFCTWKSKNNRWDCILKRYSPLPTLEKILKIFSENNDRF